MELQKLFRAQHMHVDVDVTGNTLPKKIRTGQLQQYNFIFVVGAQERDNRSVNIRNRDDPATQKLGQLVPVDEALKRLIELREDRSISSDLNLAAEEVKSEEKAA